MMNSTTTKPNLTERVRVDNTMTEHQPLLLIVDDTPANIKVLANLLCDDYRIRVADNGKKALDLALEEPPDIILLDIMMPVMDGYETCKALKADPKTTHVPILFLTAKIEVEDEEKGLSLGAADFIHKPINPSIVKARVKSQLMAKSWADFLENKNVWLQKQVEERLFEINFLQDATIAVMVSLAEFRDECTGNHVVRTREYVRALALRLAKIPMYADTLTLATIETITKTAPLHDIGKIAIPDHILLKPGRLLGDELVIMRTHSERGDEMLQQAEKLLGKRGEYFKIARQIARHHHEKWDGSGYPDGLVGDNIPIAARLMAVADVYDALTTKRPYKQSFTHEFAMDFFEKNAGTHFDPLLIKIAQELSDQFIAISEQWKD